MSHGGDDCGRFSLADVKLFFFGSLSRRSDDERRQPFTKMIDQGSSPSGRTMMFLILVSFVLSHRVVEGFTTLVGRETQDVHSILASVSRPTLRRPCLSTFSLRAGPDDEDDDDDEDDEQDLDDSRLGDWRKFRATLIDGGLPGELSSTSDDQEKAQKKKQKAVPEMNAALLAKQNEKLAEEYRTGVWAHTIGQVEVGGLLCRMPLEAELYMGKNGGFWKEKLNVMLSLERRGSDDHDVDKSIVSDDEDEDTDTKILSKVDR